MPIITHGDIDGFVSALIMTELAQIHPSRVHILNYRPDRDDAFRKILDYQIQTNRTLITDIENVWFTDLSLRPGELEWARSVNHRGIWRWVDHHVSSEDFNPDGIFHDVYLDTTGKVCTADMVWDLYLKAGGKQNAVYQAWVNIARDRDLWLREAPELSLKVDILVKTQARFGKWGKLLMLARLDTPVALARKMEVIWTPGIIEYQRSLKIAMGTSKTIKIGKFPVIFAWCTTNTSDISEEILKGSNDVAILLYTSYDRVNVSLRSNRKDVDLSKWAVLFGGGGHKQAAGASLDVKYLDKGYSEIAKTIRTSLVKPEVSKKETVRQRRS